MSIHFCHCSSRRHYRLLLIGRAAGHHFLTNPYGGKAKIMVLYGIVHFMQYTDTLFKELTACW